MINFSRDDIVNDFVNEQDVFTQAELQSQRRNILQDEEEKENNEQLQYSISFSHN